MVQRRARLYRYWIPPILWAAVIFAGSTDALGAPNTAPILATILNAVLGRSLAPSQFEMIHYLVRKAGHLGEYAIFGALVFRAIRADRRGWNWRWALAAIAIAALYAASDEWHQSFEPSRTASVWDVLIDTTGATLAQVLFFRT
jgi:VanZ family protein